MLDSLTTVHCLVALDIDTEELLEFGPSEIQAALSLLQEADVLIAHNGIGFDYKALKKVFPEFNPKGRLMDTLVMSRVLWPEIKQVDYQLIQKKVVEFPPKLIGSHSLKAWGYRLGENKGEYDGGWEEFTPEMLEYCKQDVVVTKKLWDKIAAKGYSEVSMELEHDFATIIDLMIDHGFHFDVIGAGKLIGELKAIEFELKEKLQEIFPPRFLPGKPFTPKRNNKKSGYVAGATFTKIIYTEFNPGSRDHIASWLKWKYDWEPTEFGVDGKPTLDESVLKKLPFPEAKTLSEYLMIQKRIGQISTGKEGWLRHVVNGRIHGYVNPNGAVTGRCTHSKPNVGQVPSVGSPYGKECRSLFTVPKGFVLVGADASGLELRCLSHYMAIYDGGAYGKILLEGDIHTENQKAAGLPTRDNAKTFIYGFLYGAGDEKIGSIVKKGREAGRKLKEMFLKKIPALKKLIAAIGKRVKERGFLLGIDGRQLHIRHSHAALNTLLQSCGAIAVKKATVIWYKEMLNRGYTWGVDFALVAHIHDELQVQCREEIAEEVGQILVESIRGAGEFFGFRCPLDGEYKIGKSWADTH